MKKDKLNRMGIEKLSSLYSIVNELCSDYSRMTDGYSLATGDNKFENMPKDIVDMVSDRQRFFSYRGILKEMIKNKVTKIFEDEQD